MQFDEHVGLSGWLVIEINGQEVQRVRNLITETGDKFYGERAAGVAGAPAQVTGMRLGTGATPATKTGAAAALGAYVAGSNKAIDGGFPTSTQPGGAGTARRIQWKSSWAAGEADGVALAEVVITNETPLTDAAGTAGNTISRALFGPYTLGLLDTITVVWSHDIAGM